MWWPGSHNTGEQGSEWRLSPLNSGPWGGRTGCDFGRTWGAPGGTLCPVPQPGDPLGRFCHCPSGVCLAGPLCLNDDTLKTHVPRTPAVWLMTPRNRAVHVGGATALWPHKLNDATPEGPHRAEAETQAFAAGKGKSRMGLRTARGAGAPLLLCVRNVPLKLVK